MAKKVSSRSQSQPSSFLGAGKAFLSQLIVRMKKFVKRARPSIRQGKRMTMGAIANARTRIAAWDRRLEAAPWFKKLSRYVAPRYLKLAGAQLVLAGVILAIVFSNGIGTLAATSTWTQSDWSGGVGAGTSNQFASQSNITFSTPGQLTANLGGEWYGDGWSYRKQITIRADQIPGSTPLVDYPFLVNTTDLNWRSVANGGRVAQTDGGDILFTDANGSKLDHEIEVYTASTGELVAWVRIPSLSATADTNIYMYYGNDAGGLSEQNPEAVWSSSFVLVQHMNQTSGNFLDSTVRNHDGTDINTVTRNVAGRSGRAVTFNGTSQYIASTFSTPVTTKQTLCTAVRRLDTSTPGSSAGSAQVGIFVNVIGGIAAYAADDSLDYGSLTSTDNTINQWQSVCVVYDGTLTGNANRMKLYVDGQQKTLTFAGGATIPASLGAVTNAPFWIGRQMDPPTRYLRGSVDEVRLSTNALTADWIATEHNNSNSPTAFYGVGVEQQIQNESNWVGSGWTHRSKIIIDADQIPGSSALTDYPLLIKTTDPNWRSISNGGKVAQANGGDILFADSRGAKLYHEIESYTASTGELVSWVRIPSLSATADTNIYMYYGNDVGNLNEHNPAGVWSSNHVMVQHMNQTSGNFLDSTSNDYDGTVVNSVTRGATGAVGGAATFNGTNQYIDIASDIPSINGATAQTICSLVKKADAGTAGTTMGWFDGAAGMFALANFGPGSWAVFGGDQGGDYGDSSDGVIGQWQSVCVVYNGALSGNANRLKLFVNGQQKTVTFPNASVPIAIPTLTDDSFFIGKQTNFTGRFFNGSLDEVRVNRTALSADWLATEYANYIHPETFYTVENQGELISAPFDTGDTGSFVGNLSWDEDENGAVIKFQLRTAPDNAGAPGTWTDWLGPTSTSDYYTASDSGNIHAMHADATNDQWIQYKVILEFNDEGQSSTLEEVRIEYVANSPPEFNPDYPTAAAGGVQAAMSEDTAGSVDVSFSVRDEDTSTGSNTPGFVTPSFEYSLNGGGSWVPIGSSYIDESNLDVEAVQYTTHSLAWNAGTQIPDTYTTDARIRVTIDDNEGGNNTASATSSSFILDTALPVVGSVAIDTSVSPSPVTLVCTDDSSLEMRIGYQADLSDADYEIYASSTTISGAYSGDQVYIQCRDAYGNESAIRTIDIPDRPVNLFYQDISDASNDDYRMFLAWSVIDVPNAGFGSYEVYRSTDGTNYTIHTTITNRSTNYLIDTGLSSGTTYYYKLRALDAEGSSSEFSTVVSDDPDGAGGTDLSPPSVSNVSTGELSATGITVTWTSNELSNSTVYYQATNADPGLDPSDYGSSQGVPSMVTDHVVSLANLLPGTTYYYLVTSADPSGNVGVASSSGTFTTSAGPVITNVSIPEIFNDQATVVWQTDVPANSTVYYSTNSDMSSAVQFGSSDLVSDHRVTLTGLATGMTYYLYIGSEDGNGNIAEDKNIVDGEVRYYSFTTTSDGAPPLITNVSAALVGETGATIAWTTNEGATSQVEWGLGQGMGNFTSVTNVYTTQHAVTLTGLRNTTTYYFRVLSSDRAGNSSTDNNGGDLYSFKTLTPTKIIEVVSNTFVANQPDVTPPIISNVKVESVGAASAMVSFVTDEVAEIEITYYEEGAPDAKTVVQNAGIYSFNHEIFLTDLESGKAYFYVIVARDSRGNQSMVPEARFVHQAVSGGRSFSLTAAAQALLSRLARADSVEEAGTLAEEIFNNLRGLGIRVNTGDRNEPESQPDVNENEFSIVNPQFSSIGSREATLAWRTTFPARTVIDVVNVATSETRRFTDASYLRAHSFSLTGLMERTSYTVRITAEDETGATVTSGLLPLSTTVDNEPLSIREVKTSSTLIPGQTGRVQTVVSWLTNKPSTSQVFFGTGLSGESLGRSTLKSNSYVTEHVVIISDFAPGSIYRIQVESVDGSGAAQTSQYYSLLTPQLQENILDVIFESVRDTFGFIR